ncbi:MAG TPA: tyrosine-type recombinase/integrase [Candidatus Binatia bacterium]
MNKDELHRHLENYISIRETLGYQTHSTKALLKDFVDFIVLHLSSGPIRAQLVIDWIGSGSTQRGPSRQACRLSQVRGFLSFLRAVAPETEVPDHSMLATVRRQKPYLFTRAEINLLLNGALTMGQGNSLRPLLWHTLIGLLASTGLRIGEALRLRESDVRLDAVPPHLLIAETKFHKTRLVPMHPTTVEKLRLYADRRRQLGYDTRSDYFFISETGKPMHRRCVWCSFRRLMNRVGINPPRDGRRPSLHCLRHAFAVERLLEWYRAGIVDLRAVAPHLAVYLGHVNIQQSYWYLTATPELLGTAADRFQQYADGGETQ